MFPNDLLGLPPEHEVEFEIHLIPSTTLTSKATYLITLTELKELKVQSGKLLDTEFIRTSVLP